jgi:hypothetical protein
VSDLTDVSLRVENADGVLRGDDVTENGATQNAHHGAAEGEPGKEGHIRLQNPTTNRIDAKRASPATLPLTRQ